MPGELRAHFDEKVLSVSLATCNREVSQRETKIMSRLSHDHIVRFIGADTISEGDFLRVNICMELFHCDMASFIDNPATTTTAKSIASFARQICLGLDYIHHEGVVHCDIKPQNILVNDQGNLVKIADFGNAVELELEHTNNHTLWRGANCSHNVDMWSLGCVIAYMALGRNPFAPPEKKSTPELPINMSNEGNAVTEEPNRLQADKITPEALINILAAENEQARDDLFRMIQLAWIIQSAGWQSWEHEDMAWVSKAIGQEPPCSEPQHLLRQQLVERLGQEGIAFLDKCLALTPEKRHSPALALEHEFLANV
ncbi:hypothetical protein D6D19_10383 [Aureobasidium pullulans]|uniref:Protein kinase domain-containing protein n=1 Tax=Aureobasidium pullulans TaxID=5580 RepID=A0A4S8Z010_AURPU|nr:hypothetical protein D6D19_10383 [Aureobasidium pullulans]